MLIVLQLYHPSEEEKKDARLYADNVRELMAKHLHCSLSDFSTKVGIEVDCAADSNCC